jgi:phosphoribosylaminoimidazole-succinocarboxamide synthase
LYGAGSRSPSGRPDDTEISHRARRRQRNLTPAGPPSVGRSQPSFDKQPLRDYLAGLKAAGQWNGEAPPPPLPADVVDATSRRYLEAYRLLTGHALEDAG